jgi:hypothetical protein
VYDISTETLFVGCQDAMQRQTLVPLQDHLLAKGSTQGTGLKALEVACGTGRFATFLKVQPFPPDMFPFHFWTISPTTPSATSNAQHSLENLLM